MITLVVACRRHRAGLAREMFLRALLDLPARRRSIAAVTRPRCPSQSLSPCRSLDRAGGTDQRWALPWTGSGTGHSERGGRSPPFPPARALVLGRATENPTAHCRRCRCPSAP